MKKTILILAFVASSIITFGQDFDFNRLTVEQAIATEHNSELLDTVNFGILENPHIDIETLVQTKALIFKRTDDDFDPQLHIWYYFDPELKEPKGKLYNWGLFNPSFNPSKNMDLLKSYTKREKEFKRKFENIKKQLTEQFGEPTTSKTIADHKERLVQQAFWVTNKLIIGTSLEFQRKLVEIPGVGIIGEFRVQVMATYK